MNERIKQLSDIAYQNHLKSNPHSSFGRRDDYDREFAELIVRECLKLLVTGEGNENTSDAIWDLEELGVDVSKLLDDIKDEQ
jgi:hypothetical protein